MQIQLKREWQIGEEIGGGGFGKVFSARGPAHANAVAKFVPKAAGAERELLFVDLVGFRNVIPIIDSGETHDSWVIVMPRAELSLRERIAASQAIGIEEAISILADVATALADLDGKAVHRDVKPENILRFDGHWCLADFGISRYAEATTAPDTQKYALSPLYASPERWRGERATIAADVYSVGVIAYELLSGEPPFDVQDLGELREKHLHVIPAPLSNVSPVLGALVEECLYKAPEARPRPTRLLERLKFGSQPVAAGGLRRLQEANRLEVARRAEIARSTSEARSEDEGRRDLWSAARMTLARVADELRTVISSAAPTASVEQRGTSGWRLRMNNAELSFGDPIATSIAPWGGWEAPEFRVVAHTSLNLRIPPGRSQYEGRSHSLWYADALEGRFQWLETAFMVSPFIPRRGRQNPFSLDPGLESAKAFWKGMAEFQVAWSWTPLNIGDLHEFADRWAGWFADAAEGKLQHPSHMPER